MACRKVIFMMCILAIFSKIEICCPDIASENMFVEVANKVKPAVVSIVTKHANEVKEKISERIDYGSGMIIDTEGYILTADSVVTNAEDIKVILPDRREFDGELKGMDKRFGVAVIKIDAKGLPAVGFGDSDALKVRQFVIASGYQGNGSGPTFIVGVINAFKRSLPPPSNYVFGDLIQTDAPILPGFGGGPLVNIKGEVIGVLYVHVTDGVSCAIPVNSVKQAIDSLIKHGRVTSGWLGVGIWDIKPELAKSLGLLDLNGVFVMEVFPDTPAEKAGLRVEDVIRSFDGKDIKSPSDLMLAVATTDVGKRVKVLIIRDKSEKEIEVEVGERPEEKKSTLMRKSKTKQEVLVIGDIPVIGKIRSDAKEDESGSGYALTVEADGAYLLRFPPNSEPEVAGSIDQIFQNHTRLDIQFVPGVDQSAIQKLEEYMHDRNFSITSRIRATEEGQGITSWTLRKNPERLQIYIGRNIEERQTRGRRQTGVYEVHATDLGKHIQVGELQEVDKEPTRITIFFDDEGKVLLKNFIAQNPGQKLFLQTEGVGVGEGEVPNEGDWTSLTFTLSPGKLKRLEHAFEMSKLQLIRTKR